jgi:putative SOS response-associated peptidase YedK
VKQPYFIGFADGAPFGMAGLWERWRDPASGEPLESCCIVTTTPAASVAHVHDRMPVIIPAAAYAEWLDPRNEATDGLIRLLEPCTRPDLLARPVSRRVNDARNQGPDLIEQLAAPASDA